MKRFSVLSSAFFMLTYFLFAHEGMAIINELDQPAACVQKPQATVRCYSFCGIYHDINIPKASQHNRLKGQLEKNENPEPENVTWGQLKNSLWSHINELQANPTPQNQAQLKHILSEWEEKDLLTQPIAYGDIHFDINQKGQKDDAFIPSKYIDAKGIVSPVIFYSIGDSIKAPTLFNEKEEQKKKSKKSSKLAQRFSDVSFSLFMYLVGVV